MKSDMTPSRLVIIIFFISMFLLVIVNYYGGYFKDEITKRTCSLFGEEYASGEKKGDGNCILPVGSFD